MTIKNKIVTAQKPRNEKGQFLKSPKKLSASPFIAKDPDPFTPDNLPVGVVPHTDIKHVNIFRGIANGGTNIYRNLDEALRQSRANAKAMRNDLVITEPLLARELAVAQLEDHLVPEDEKDEYQKEVVDGLTKLIRKIPRWSELKRNLAEALWYGKMCIVVDYAWEWKNGKKQLVVKDWKPISGDKLCWRNNDLEFGYLVHWPTGLREVVYTDIGRAELFNETDKECLILHKYFIVDTNYDEPELAIGVHGVGLRNFLYWTWWMKQELLGWLFDVFQRYGAGGLQIWYFEQGNPASEAAVREAAEHQTQNNILLFPRPIGTEKQGPGLEIVTPEGAGIEWFYNFINEYFGGQIRRLILGNDGDIKSRISEGGSDLIKSDFVRLLKYDAEAMQESITNSLVKTLLKYNYPDCDAEIKYEISVDKPDPDVFLEAAQRAYEIGMEIDEDQLRSVIGLTSPTDSDRILKKPKGEDNTIKSPKKETGNLGEQLS